MGSGNYTSERFIHDDLCAYADRAVQTLYNSWKKYKCIKPFFITWPAETVLSSEGTHINGECLLGLEDTPRQEWSKTLLEAIQLTKAYAILLVEQTPTEVLVILESKHGTKSWHLPVNRRGDVDVLGPPTTAVDQKSLGYLWRPNLGQA